MASLPPEIQKLLQQKNFAVALPLLQENFAQVQDLNTLRLILGLCAELKDWEALQEYNSKLLDLSPHDAAHYFFKGLWHENQGLMDEAVTAYKQAFGLLPAQKQAFERAWHLIKKSGQEKKYLRQADLVFHTGYFFMETHFSPPSLEERGLGGSESAFIYLTREIAKRGMKVLAFCNCDRLGLYDNVEYLPVEDFAFFHQLNQFQKIVGLRNPDAFLADLNPRARHFFWLQDAATTQLYRDFDLSSYRIDEVFVLSQSHKKSWQSHFGLADEKFFVTRNGYDPRLFFPRPERRQQLIYMSRPERGLKEAVAVFQQVKKQFPELKLLLCTYSHKSNLLEDPLIQEVESLFGLEGVEFLGSLPKAQLARHLQESLLLLHPNVLSYVETSCIAAIEAQACGVPVVCGRGGAMEETVQDGKTGIVVDFDGDRDRLVEKMTQAVESLLGEQKLYTQMSAAAAKWAHDHYRWESVAGEWLKHLKSKNPLAV